MSDENYNHLDSNSQNLNLNNPQQLSSPKQSTVQQTQNEQQPMMDQPITMNQMMMGIIQMGYIIVDPMEILDTAPSIKIKQQIELLEVITGCQTKNRYDVYAEVNSQKYYLFYKYSHQLQYISHKFLFYMKNHIDNKEFLKDT